MFGIRLIFSRFAEEITSMDTLIYTPTSYRGMFEEKNASYGRSRSAAIIGPSYYWYIRGEAGLI